MKDQASVKISKKHDAKSSCCSCASSGHLLWCGRTTLGVGECTGKSPGYDQYGSGFSGFCRKPCGARGSLRRGEARRRNFKSVFSATRPARIASRGVEFCGSALQRSETGCQFRGCSHCWCARGPRGCLLGLLQPRRRSGLLRAILPVHARRHRAGRRSSTCNHAKERRRLCYRRGRSACGCGLATCKE